MVADFDIQQVLQVIGPTASLLFAAWIFLQYLNQRFTESVERLRDLAENLRQATKEDRRRASVVEQIKLYQRRCVLMRWATHTGLVAAVLLLITLTLAAIVTVFHGPSAFGVVAVVCAWVGLTLVVAATVLVVRENMLVGDALRSELADLDLPR